MLLLLAFCFFQFHRVSPQFPDHVDFQKLGEVFYKGEKYNLLKETRHSVRDHFKDFIQRRESDDFPTKKVFLDKNGFRHYWSGLFDKTSFRKVGVDDENVLKLLKQNKTEIKSETQIKYDEFKAEQEEVARHIRRKLNKIDKIVMKPVLKQRAKGKANIMRTDKKKATTATTKKTTTKSKTGATTKATATKATATKATATKATATKATNIKATTAKGVSKQQAKTQSGNKIIMTQFFCPYFGIVTLTSALD